MKLCLIAPVSPPNGGVANWEKILEKKIREDKDISLHIIDISTNKRLADGRTVFDRIIYGGYIMCKAYIQTKAVVKRKETNVVHMTTSGGLGFFRDILILKYLKKKGVKSIYHIHFGRAVLYCEKNGREWKQLCRAVGMASQTIAIDMATYNLLKPFAKNIVLINNPIDITSYSGYEIKELKIIVYIGELIKAKGIEELLQAFAIFNEKKDCTYTLKLVGPGDDRYVKDLKNKYSFDRVDVTGEMKHADAMKVLSKAEIFILPSYTEGSPNVILEAMVLGKAIIATNVGAIPEMLADNAGMLIRPYSMEDILNALIRLSEDQLCRAGYGKCAYNKVRNDYDMEEVYLKYKKLWEERI